MSTFLPELTAAAGKVSFDSVENKIETVKQKYFIISIP